MGKIWGEALRARERGAYRLVPLKQNHTSTLVSRRQIITGVVKLDSRDDIRCKEAEVSPTVPSGGLVERRFTFCDVFYISFIAKASGTHISQIAAHVTYRTETSRCMTGNEAMASQLYLDSDSLCELPGRCA